MNEYDAAVLDAFLKEQKKLFPETVASTREEAEDFLEECMAVVVESPKEVWEYFDEEGVDIAGMDEADILEADEVFAVGDGRYLIVEC
jgi:hypothetical protein